MAFHEGQTGLPLLDGALATLECRVVESHEAGDHTIFIGQVESASVETGRPLVYFHGAYQAVAADTRGAAAAGGSPRVTAMVA